MRTIWACGPRPWTAALLVCAIFGCLTATALADKIAVVARGNGQVPDAVRIDVLPDDTRLAASVATEVQRRLQELGVRTDAGSPFVLRVVMASGEQQALTESRWFNLHGNWAESNRRDFSVTAVLRDRAKQGRKGNAHSVAITLFEQGQGPSWTGIATRDAAAPPTTADWLDLTDAALDYLGENTAE